MPAGFLPRVYYGLTRGGNTYRFISDTVLNVTLTNEATIGDAFEFYSNEEAGEYIPAVGILINENQIRIVIQGDYTVNTNDFDVENMRSGDVDSLTFTNPLALQEASYLGEYPAEDYKEKQIVVLNDLITGKNNLLFASIDINGDNVYNWVSLGGFLNGTDGKSLYSVSSATASTVFNLLKAYDSFVIASDFTYNGVSYEKGDVYIVNTVTPLSTTKTGSLLGPQGTTGATGANGQDGTDGYTPYIQDNYWYINGVNTNVKALGTDGTNGTDGQSFQMQSGLYSTPDNWGETGNTDGEGNPLLQLPTLPQSAISGKGYVVYDPLTTPLEPFYDLYYANNGDLTWTVIHPFSGLKGADGTDGYTPYIQNNQWYINGTSTGVQATGDTGATGPMGNGFYPIYNEASLISLVNPAVGDIKIKVGDYIVITSTTSFTTDYARPLLGTAPTTFDPGYLFPISGYEYNSTLQKNVLVFMAGNYGNIRGPQGVQGATGPTGATPQISASATGLSAGSSPTVTVSGTTDNPILTFGIPAGAVGATFTYNNGVLTITTP